VTLREKLKTWSKSILPTGTSAILISKPRL